MAGRRSLKHSVDVEAEPDVTYCCDCCNEDTTITLNVTGSIVPGDPDVGIPPQPILDDVTLTSACYVRSGTNVEKSKLADILKDNKSTIEEALWEAYDDYVSANEADLEDSNES